MSPIAMPADVELEVLGDLHRQRLDVDLARDLRERAALAARPAVSADELRRSRSRDRLVETDLLEVDVRQLPAERILLVVLEDRRMRRLLAVETTSRIACIPPSLVERAAKLALGDRRSNAARPRP